jgi:hypothetical protein
MGQQRGNRLGEKKATRRWLYKVPEGTSLEPVEGNLLVGFASILVNCDSSWNEFSCGAEQSGIPHSGEFAPFVAKKCILFGVNRLIFGRKGCEIASSPSKSPVSIDQGQISPRYAVCGHAAPSACWLEPVEASEFRNWHHHRAGCCR